jgi:cytidylate kinase
MAIITISRGTKSGGLKLAQCLSARLGYKSISREVILEGAKKYNILEDDLARRLDEAPSLWQKFTRQHQRYLVFIRCALIDAVKEDNVVYHGYGGQFFLRGISHVMKIRLDAPLEDRIAIIMREEGMSYEEAKNYVANVDEQRFRWVKYTYGEDWRDPTLYDMSFCTSNLTIDSVCEIVSKAIDREEFQTTELSRQKLSDLSLESEVRAALAADDRTWNIPVSVKADNGTVTLNAMVKNDKSRSWITELVKQVKGLKECDVRIGLSTDPLSKGIYGHN